jgi:hypothetical protein
MDMWRGGEGRKDAVDDGEGRKKGCWTGPGRQPSPTDRFHTGPVVATPSSRPTPEGASSPALVTDTPITETPGKTHRTVSTVVLPILNPLGRWILAVSNMIDSNELLNGLDIDFYFTIVFDQT